VSGRAHVRRALARCFSGLTDRAAKGGSMRYWIRENWVIYLPVAGILVFAAGLMLAVALQSRYSAIEVSDQSLVSGRATIDKAFLRSDGFVAIHLSDANGDLVRSSSIGHAPLESGVSFNVEVGLLQPVATGTKLFAVIHRDTDADKRYEFGRDAPGRDPIEMVGGKPVAAAFSLN
jgi:hypothetical protein